MTKVLMLVPTLNNYEGAYRVVVSALTGSRVPDEIVVVDNGVGVSVALFAKFPQVRVLTTGCNLGVAASWNLGIRLSRGSATLLVNDDVVLLADTVERLVSHDEPIVSVYEPAPPHVFPFCCFLVRQEAIDRLGYFDENYWPAYYEDAEFFMRLKQCDVPFRIAHDARVRTGGRYGATSSKLRADVRSLYQARYAGNRERFIERWGIQAENNLQASVRKHAEKY